MSTLEERIHDALAEEARTSPPSPDLFARVVRSIEEDRAHRRRVRRTVLGWTLVPAALAALVFTLTPQDKEGFLMPWWIVEVATNLALLAIALWLGPFIKRFGRAYAADVFHDNPLTGKSYIVLTDIVYYLIFSAYIMFTVHFAPALDWGSEYSGLLTAAQLTFEVARVGGILLIIGILHGLNIVLMPVLGRLFSLNRRMPDKASRPG